MKAGSGERLIELRREVTRSLGGALDRDGRIRDPSSGAAAPPDHYAQTFAALALHYQPEAGDWRLALEHWLALPAARRGHEPFNRLALLLLRRALADDPASGRAERQLVEQGLRRCRTRRRYAANNWALLSDVCALGEARGRIRRAHARARLLRHLERWQTAAGGFIDFPRRPHPAGRGIATPVAYHCKLVLCLWLACCLAPEDAELARPLARGLGWLRLVAAGEGGWLAGLGRSTHALYADACLLTVLWGLLEVGGAQGRIAQEVQDAVEGAADGIAPGTLFSGVVARLAGQRRGDGLLDLNPTGAEGEAGCWDPYMHVTVYNAWAAGLWAAVQEGHPWLRAPAEGGQPPLSVSGPGQYKKASAHAQARSPVLLQDPEAGLAHVETGGAGWVLSTRGQPVQGYSARRVDLRQAAGVPVHAEIGGRSALPAGCLLPVDRLIGAPWLAGWTPLVEQDGQLYAMLRLEEVAVETTERGVRMGGRGAPVAAHRLMGRGMLSRALEAADWRWLGRARARRQALVPPRLAEHEWHVAVELTGSSIQHRLTLIGSPSSRARLLNPRGAAWLVGAACPDPRLRPRFGEMPSPTGAARGGCAAPMAWPAFTLVIEHALELLPEVADRDARRTAT